MDSQVTDTVLYLAHTEADGSLARHALEALTAAQTTAAILHAPLIVGLFGGETKSAARLIGSCGAARVLVVEGAEFSQARYSSDAAASEAIAKASEATVVVAAHTSRLARVLAGVAQRLNGRIDTHVNGIDSRGGLAVTRWFYRQRMEGVLRRTQRPWVLLLDSGCTVAYSGEPADVPAVPVEVALQLQRTRTIGLHAPQAGQETIRPDAALLFVAGAGWTKKQKDGQPHTQEAEELILEFLRASQASLGSTKSLTDISGEGQTVLQCMSHLNQVGQTGSTPRHPKGLSTCCHGEEPHVVGWRFIHERRAINLDANCGWARGKADVLYIADAFEVMRKVNQLLACPVQ
jgi:electron transfer flavoprotein alpha subunit